MPWGICRVFKGPDDVNLFGYSVDELRSPGIFWIEERPGSTESVEQVTEIPSYFTRGDGPFLFMVQTEEQSSAACLWSMSSRPMLLHTEHQGTVVTQQVMNARVQLRMKTVKVVKPTVLKKAEPDPCFPGEDQPCHHACRDFEDSVHRRLNTAGVLLTLHVLPVVRARLARETRRQRDCRLRHLPGTHLETDGRVHRRCVSAAGLRWSRGFNAPTCVHGRAVKPTLIQTNQDTKHIDISQIP